MQLATCAAAVTIRRFMRHRCAREIRSLTARGVLVASIVLWGCNEEAATPDPATKRLSDAERMAVPGDDLTILEDLAQVGYVDYAAPDSEVGAGVVLSDERAAPGYNLVTSIPDSKATLFDMGGRVLRTWTDPDFADARWTRVEILEDGDVVSLSPKVDYLLRTSWDGVIRWRLPLNVHHDSDATPNGEFLVLTRKFRQIPELNTERQCVDNFLTLVSADGRVLEERSLYDAIQSSGILNVQEPEDVDKLPPSYNIDPIHANTVEWFDRPELAEKNPLFATTNVLVTLRYLDSIAIFDWKTAKIIWAWGDGELEGPHDATLLESGNILLLDNGYEDRAYSRIVEVDPLTRQIVWQWRAPEPSDFYTSGRGTVQRLPNDNILIGNSNSGEAFEITRAGEMVWRYLNPFVDEEGARGVIRIQRYEPAFIEPFLRGGAAK